VKEEDEMINPDTAAQTRPVTPPRAASRPMLVVSSVLAGAAIASLWSYEFVDDVIAGSVAGALLGRDVSAEAGIAGTVAGIVFAFVSGLAGTFTACNVAALGAVPALLDPAASSRRRLRAAGAALTWLTVGMLTVAATYGALGAVLGERLPQLSDELIGGRMPVRLLQSVVVFGVIGAVLVVLGLSALGVVPDPLRRASARYRQTRLLVLGALIGGFLVGRPFPMFRTLFASAVESGNPAYGALTFSLQSVGNVVVMALLLLLLAAGPGGRFARWLSSRPGRPERLAGSALLTAGSFTFCYWVLRVPSVFGWGWYPALSWS